MAHKIIWLGAALDDLEEIVRFIEKDSRRYASLVATKLVDAAEVVRRDGDLQGAEVILQLLHGPRPDDRRGDDGVGQGPGQGQNPQDKAGITDAIALGAKLGIVFWFVLALAAGVFWAAGVDARRAANNTLAV